MSTSPQSQISDAGQVKRGVEKFSRMIDSTLRMGAIHKNSSDLG